MLDLEYDFGIFLFLPNEKRTSECFKTLISSHPLQAESFASSLLFVFTAAA
jgi:hypothetical protein